ncbi:ABC transporter permease [uncultured Draconibacterium sp.]|uniref:ABC transporter permease n=1 Tax=uncultured Draconibacterium sp. TaxID=1573823 RepID=UPI0032176C61
MKRYLISFIRRHFLKNKISTAINLFSLVLAFSSCLLIYSYILNEFKYDTSFAQHDRLYRVASKVRMGGVDFSSSMAAPPLAKTLVREIPEVQKATRLWQWPILSVKKENVNGESISYNEQLVTEADSNFFDVFDFKLLQGDIQSCLKNPNAIVVTEETAIKYFGAEAYSKGEVMGQNLQLKIFGRYRPYQIMGICENPPKQLHFGFSLLFSSNADPDSNTDHWLNNTYYTYALLAPAANASAVEEKLGTIVKKHVNQGYGKQFALNDETAADYWKFILQPITSIHLTSDFERELKANGSIRNIKISGGIALMILLIAIMNYMNLFMVGNFRRAKEIAVRKISGMKKSAVFWGFISESVLFVSIAMLLALCITFLSYGFLEPISTGIRDLAILQEPLTYLLILMLVLLSGVAGGIYPALKMVEVKNITLLKSAFGESKGGNTFRQVLVISQFVIAITLIVSSIVVSRQLNFLMNKNPGFDKEHVVVCDAPVFALRQNFENFKTRLLNHPDITAVSTANTVPGDGDFNFPLYLKEEGETSHQVVIPYEGSYDFIATLGLEILDGRDFAKNYDDQNSIILNETAVRALGLNDPVGTFIYNSEVRANTEELTRLKIVGVVKDIHFESYHKQIRPFAIQLRNFHNYLVLRTTPGNLAKTLAFVEESWNETYPDAPFKSTFLDKKFEMLYQQEAGMKLFFLLFTGMAIFIALIGLFALSVFITNQRTKEIGIRKVNGAKVVEVLALLNKDFIKWVSIAFVISCPLAWYAMDYWLGNFAYKTSLSWWIFALAGVLALGIALLTVSFQSWKAATRNPVEALRYE